MIAGLAPYRLPLLLTLAAMTAACEGELEAPPSEADQVEADADAEAANATTDGFPLGLEPEEEGYPNPDDECRRLADTQAISNWRSEGDVLFGCPTFADADALRDGRTIEKIGGITLVAVPRARVEAVLARQGRTLAESRSYDTRVAIPCGIAGGEPVQSCMAGVVRSRAATPSSPAGGRIEVQTPRGDVRPFLFEGTNVNGIDTASRPDLAGTNFSSARDGSERIRVLFGEETYLVPLALLSPPETDADGPQTPPRRSPSR
ncbi:hypothetical protein WJT74_08650 [Sphingomicrobium sp. XHP0239]|uniref:hypothetical protein n=1 Tax=Sphingomicrobium maritimum TaxID=3133972 RepID=UPI0031CC86F1